MASNFKYRLRLAYKRLLKDAELAQIGAQMNALFNSPRAVLRGEQQRQMLQRC
jgi:hypothetical protein